MKQLFLILILISLFLFSGCNLFEEDFEGSWTIMVWLDADNNLESMGMQDINEMEHGLAIAESNNSKLMKELAVIAQVDRIPGFDENGYGSSNWTGTKRFRIKPDYSGKLDLNSKELENMGEVNMGDPAELKDFIQFCKEQYPADHYALILWNHGSGVRSTASSGSYPKKGIAVDDTSGDILYTGEITDILTDHEDVDVIGFDACVMGTLEIAYEYRPTTNKFGANYMAASVANEQGDGWEYDKIFSRFAGNGLIDEEGDPCYDPQYLTPSKLVEIITKEYGDAFDETHTIETMVALDLTTLTSSTVTVNAKLAIDALASSLNANNRKTAFETIRGSGNSPGSLEYMEHNNSYDWYAWPHFDLYDLAERVEADPGSFGTETTAAINLQTALENLIITSYGGDNYDSPSYTSTFQPGKNGLGIFFPDGDRRRPNYTESYYYYQWWYTSADTVTIYGDAQFEYGKLDFCDYDNDGVVETWKELLEEWYDSNNTNTNDTF